MSKEITYRNLPVDEINPVLGRTAACPYSLYFTPVERIALKAILLAFISDNSQ
jgi:hypothetical protein